MPILVVTTYIVVVILPVFRSGVVWRVDVDAIHLFRIRKSESFEHMVVFAVDDDLCRIGFIAF